MINKPGSSPSNPEKSCLNMMIHFLLPSIKILKPLLKFTNKFLLKILGIYHITLIWPKRRNIVDRYHNCHNFWFLIHYSKIWKHNIFTSMGKFQFYKFNFNLKNFQLKIFSPDSLHRRGAKPWTPGKLLQTSLSKNINIPLLAYL